MIHLACALFDSAGLLLVAPRAAARLCVLASPIHNRPRLDNHSGCLGVSRRCSKPLACELELQ